MSLHDVIHDDIDRVFFNLNDFAETVAIDGKEIPIVSDPDSLGNKTELYAMGLSEGEELIFVRAADMNKMPMIGEQLTKNGKQWYIRHVINNYGVYELRIGRDTLYD